MSGSGCAQQAHYCVRGGSPLSEEPPKSLVLAYGWTEYRRLLRLEREAYANVAAVWTCSERDRRVLIGPNPSVSSAVVPNVINLDDYKPGATDDGRTVVYVGAMDWLPNRDAVEFFVSDVMPELRRLIPNVSFRRGRTRTSAEFSAAAGASSERSIHRNFAGPPSCDCTGCGVRGAAQSR